VLSYLHSYHAGNFADVHKHLALVLLLRRLQEKDTPLCYVDSHAGRGLYDLAGAEAQKTREADAGILRLCAAPNPPDTVRDYLDLVASFNDGDAVRNYPGSAALAQGMLREQDRAMLLELHPREFPALGRFIGRDRRIAIHARDCYEGLPALVPPAIRRGLVLIDPSYEIKREYNEAGTLLCKTLDRWGNAVYLLWYPLLAAGRHRFLLNELAKCSPPRMLCSELKIDSGTDALLGSGLVIVNTPWQFETRLRDAMAFVRHVLDPSGKAGHTLRWMTDQEGT